MMHDMYQPARSPRPEGIRIQGRTKAERLAESEAWMRNRQAAVRPTIPARYQQIMEAACQSAGVTPSRLMSRDRSKPVMRARHRACRDLRAIGLTYEEIARALHLKDHTAALYHCIGKAGRQRISNPQPRPIGAPFVPDGPDLSGEWAI